MNLEELISALEGPDVHKATEVTYGLDGNQCPTVLAAVRSNLERDHADLVEISVMRLGVRFKDASSFSKIVELARNQHDFLVRLAAFKALSAIPERHPHLKGEAESILTWLVEDLRDPELKAEAAREYLRLTGKVSLRQYASLDDAEILSRYKARPPSVHL